MRNVSIELDNLRQRDLATLRSQQMEMAARLESGNNLDLDVRIAALEHALVNITSRVTEMLEIDSPIAHQDMIHFTWNMLE